MFIKRRFFLGGMGASALLPGYPLAHDRDSEGNAHTHPHVPSHTPVHFPSFGGVEHSFLMKEFRSFAGMPRCWMVIEHGMDQSHPSLERLASFNENVPFYIHEKNEVEGLSQEQIKAALFGEVTNWRDFGGRDLPIEIFSNGQTRWKWAFGTMLATSFLNNSDEAKIGAMKMIGQLVRINEPERVRMVENSRIRVNWKNQYEAVAAASRASIGALAVSLRPTYAGGLKPILINGQTTISPSYPIQVESHINVRKDRDDKRDAATEIIEELLKKYESDQNSLSRLLS